MTDAWKKVIGAILLITTMGFSSCGALLNVNTDHSAQPIYLSTDR